MRAAWGSPEGLFAVGDGGAALFRDPRGRWRALPTATAADLTAVHGAGREVVAVGRSGIVLRLERE